MSESVGGREAKVLGREPSSNKNERNTLDEIMGLFNNKPCPRHLCPSAPGPSPLAPVPVPEAFPLAQRPISVPDPLGRPESRRHPLPSSPQTPAPHPSPSSTEVQLVWDPWQPVLRVISGQISTPKLAGLLGGHCGGGGCGKRRGFSILQATGLHSQGITEELAA